MSKWASSGTPRHARKLRTEAILSNHPDSTSTPLTDLRPIPQWLINEQNKLRNQNPDDVHAPSLKPTRPTTPPRASQLQDDFIIVDLLDGAHVPTHPKHAQQQQASMAARMSSNSDSIISLPPVDGATVPDTWHALRRAEAQEMRRNRHRLSASVGQDGQLAEMKADASGSSSATNSIPPLPPNAAAAAAASAAQAAVPFAVPPSQATLPNSSTASASVHAKPIVKPRGLNPSHIRHASDSHSAFLHHADSTTPLRGSGHHRSGSYKWFDDENDSWASVAFAHTSSSSSSSNRKPKNRRHSKQKDSFHPNVWEGRKPAEEDSVMPNGAWIYLALIGSLAFFIAFVVNMLARFLSRQVISNISEYIGVQLGPHARVATLATLRGLSLVASFALVLKLSPHYAAGSGIPEMKCVLGGVLMPQMLNWQTLVAKMIGMMFSLSSGISIGRLGPFIHMSCITAALVSKLPTFPVLRNNTRYQLQALSAAMAAGVGATVGAPIGGTLLAVELMSTYYYIHWLPMALYCSIMGFYFTVTVSGGAAQAYFTTTAQIDLTFESGLHLMTYALIGALCGVVGAGLVHFTKLLFVLRRKFFGNAKPWRTAGLLFGFAAAHTLITTAMGGVLGIDQRSAVISLLSTDGEKSDAWLPSFDNVFPSSAINNCAALLLVAIVKFILTGMSLVMPVPAGTFMPIFETGALLGRAFGEGWRALPLVSWVDPRATAIIGAAALTSGALHTVSIAVVMLELTREEIDVLPLTVGVIVSYGVSKRLCSDLFSELIKIRQLPYILGLRERYPWETKQFFEETESIVAGLLMNSDFPYVTPQSTRGEIYELLTARGKPWVSCAFVSDREERRLLGTIAQQTLWDIISVDMKRSSSGSLDEPEYGTFEASERATRRGLETIEFLQTFDSEKGHPHVDTGAMQVSYYMPFWKVLTLFRMLSAGQVFVMQEGKTMGILTKADVITLSIKLEDRLKRKRQGRRDENNGGGRRSVRSGLVSQQRGGGPNGRAVDAALAAAFAERRGSGRHSRQNSVNTSMWPIKS